MSGLSTDWLPAEALLLLPGGHEWAALAVLVLAAAFFATGVPGTLVPLSFSSGALLGWPLGVAAVGAGALAGSLVLYSLVRRGARAAWRDRYGERLKRLREVVERGGILALIGLRLVGVPHALVTALCAAASVGTRRYAIATLLGTFPAIALSATAGAAL